MKTQALESKLLFAQNAISNSKGNDEVKAMLAELGYDESRLQEGQTLYSATSELQTRQVKERGKRSRLPSSETKLLTGYRNG